jgi:hypothetical protein
VAASRGRNCACQADRTRRGARPRHGQAAGRPGPSGERALAARRQTRGIRRRQD